MVWHCWKVTVVSTPGETLTILTELPLHAAYLFDRFYRADPLRERTTGGSGLGLAISKAYVEGQNGRIWLENSSDGGATFTFTLPTTPDQ